jgi:16S rRNA (cytosine1402-N4)-methyltransferase
VEIDNFHEPVLINDTIRLLLANVSTSKVKVYIDGTLGGGGYTKKILELSEHDVKVLAIDRDINAIEHSSKVLQDFSGRIIFCNGNFADIAGIIPKYLDFTLEQMISGLVLDLGLSTYQLNYEEGFSYQRDTELDMRADKGIPGGIKAKDILNTYPEKDLQQIFKDYGELRYNRQITRDIIEYRKIKRFEKTLELVELLKKKIPVRYLNKDLSKVFQALRIEVNNELDNLKKVLNDTVEYLEPGGRMVVVSYHSLEDRIVKNFFRSNEKLKVVTKKPVTPDEDEIERNVRARSAKLRAAEKIILN